MTDRYHNEMVDIAIKYAGYDVLADTALCCEAADTSALFDKKMRTMIGRKAAWRHAAGALKITSRVAAILAVIILISTAVIFSSEALRIQAANLIHEMGGGTTTIGVTNIDTQQLPEGIILPKYLPDGYEFSEASQSNQTTESLYVNEAGGSIRLVQGVLNRETKVNSDNSYEAEIDGRTVYVVENEELNIVLFNNDWNNFIISGDVDVSELLNIAESILI